VLVFRRLAMRPSEGGRACFLIVYKSNCLFHKYVFFGPSCLDLGLSTLKKKVQFLQGATVQAA
jgi:hypothetical protein